MHNAKYISHLETQLATFQLKYERAKEERDGLKKELQEK